MSALASAVSPADNCCPIRGFMFSRCLLHSFYSRLWLSPQASAVPSPHFSSFALLLCVSPQQKHLEHYRLDGFDFVGLSFFGGDFLAPPAFIRNQWWTVTE